MQTFRGDVAGGRHELDVVCTNRISIAVGREFEAFLTEPRTLAALQHYWTQPPYCGRTGEDRASGLSATGGNTWTRFASRRSAVAGGGRVSSAIAGIWQFHAG